MTQSNTTSLELISTRICPLTKWSNPDTDLFISRWGLQHNFLATEEMNSIAIRIILNKNRDSNIILKNIRQKISIAIIDLYDNTQVSHTSFYASLPKGVVQKIYVKNLKLTHFHTSHHELYKVVITNETENHELDSYDFRLIDYHEAKKTFKKMVTPFHAAIEAYDCQYLRVNRDISPCPALTFMAKTKYPTTHKLLEEFEVRIYYPNGEIESTIHSPHEVEISRCKTWNPIRISTEVSTYHEGVVYAELRHFGIAIAGILFNAGYDEYEGEWSDFTPIPNYTPQKGEITFNEAFQKHIATHGASTEPKPLVDEEEFNKFLEDIIKAEEENNQKNAQEEEDDNEDNEEEEDEFEKLSKDFCDFVDEAVKNMPENDDDWGFAEDEDLDDDKCFEESHDTSSKENCWENLNNLTGLQSVKDKLHAYQNLVNFTKLRAENHLTPIKIPLHAMFLGSPGTGKTTIAKAMGQMLHNMGILSKGHVVVKERSTLIGKFYSDEEVNTLNALEEAQGGILFIDEAYQLYSEHDPRDPGRLVIETLMTKLADESNRDWMLILAGYPEEMMKLYHINPGLASRIPSSNIYTFDDYSENELLEIAENYLSQNQYSLSDEAREALLIRLKADYSSRDKSFGNARHVINLIQLEILPRIATRISKNPSPSIDDLTTILASDIPEPIKKELTTRRKIGFC